MAVGDPYVSIADVKSELAISDAVDDVEIAVAVDAASEWVTSWCGRDFNVADSVSARVFYPSTRHRVAVDDIASTSGLVVAIDQGNDATYETTVAATMYQLEPVNGLVAGRSGWPYTSVRLVQSLHFPAYADRRAPVQITALWGWPSVPAAVKKATLIMASRLFKRRLSPEGILGGLEGFGAVRVGTRLDPDVEMLLAPYRRRPVLVA